MILWTMDPAERDANLVHGALKRRDGGADDHLAVLVEVACAYEPDHLVGVRRAYRALFACSVEEDVASSSALPQPLKKACKAPFQTQMFSGKLSGTVAYVNSVFAVCLWCRCW